MKFGAMKFRAMMFRARVILLLVLSPLLTGSWTSVQAVAQQADLPQESFQASHEVAGFYLEARTCQVYTGPCFANGESGSSGRFAVMAWHIDRGQHAGTSLDGLSVVMVTKASKTIGFQGFDSADPLKSIIYVNRGITARQQEALVELVAAKTGRAGQQIVDVRHRDIQMQLDLGTLVGQLKVGGELVLSTRKARPGDCICGNESAYYPPLAPLKSFVPGVATEYEFRGRGLGARWSHPESRSAYIATFDYSQPAQP